MTFMQAFINIIAAVGAVLLWMAVLTDKDKGKTLPQAIAFAALLVFIICYNVLM